MTSIILLATFGIVNLFLGFMKSNRIILPAVLLFLAIVFGVNLIGWNDPKIYFNNMLTIDNFAIGFTGIMLLSTLLIVPFAESLARSRNENLPELLSLLLFALVGGMMMVSYENMLMLFIGIEIMSISMYILAGSDKQNLFSNEAALKYFLMGAFATGILLFGITLIYGATGTFYVSEIGQVSVGGDMLLSPMLLMGLLLVLIGISFKVGAAPFHFWTPDVYEGTPTIFTSFMSTVVKTAGFAAFFKLMYVSFAGIYDFWYETLAAITVLTLVIGNIGAIAQASVKRMLAYSSISHAGYLLIALTVLNTYSENAIFFYSLAYSVATIGAFGVLKIVADARKDETYGAFTGLARTNPLLAFVMTVSMCSLAGIPLTGGFFGKFFIFSSALDQGMVWLIVVAVLMSAVGIYYYFKPVIAMYMHEPADAEYKEKIEVSGLVKAVLLITSILTIILGILPGLISDLNI